MPLLIAIFPKVLLADISIPLAIAKTGASNRQGLNQLAPSIAELIAAIIAHLRSRRAY